MSKCASIRGPSWKALTNKSRTCSKNSTQNHQNPNKVWHSVDSLSSPTASADYCMTYRRSALTLYRPSFKPGSTEKYRAMKQWGFIILWRLYKLSQTYCYIINVFITALGHWCANKIKERPEFSFQKQFQGRSIFTDNNSIF